MFCHNCGKNLRDGVHFCSECGASMVSTCPKCGAEMQMDEKFCSQCGYRVNESGSVVLNAPVQPTPVNPVQPTPVAPVQITPAAPVQVTPIAPAQTVSAASAAPAAETSGKEKTQSVTGDGQMVIVGGRQIWRARITEIPTEIKIERTSGMQGTKRVSTETFYKYSFKLVDVQDENGKPSVKNVRKAKKSVKTCFVTDEITEIFFKTCPVFYLSDVLRIIFMAVAILLLCGYDRWYSYLGALVVVGVFLFMTRCRQLQIQLKGGTVVKIPLKQDADAAIFLQTLGFSAKADQAAQGGSSETSWKVRTLAVNYLLILIAGVVVGVGIDMHMEDETTSIVSESMSTEEKSPIDTEYESAYDDSAKDKKQREKDTSEYEKKEIETQHNDKVVVSSEQEMDSDAENKKLYESILNSYYDLLENGASCEDFKELSYSELVSSYSRELNLENIGYAFYDLDGNGTDELFIGCVQGKDLALEGTVKEGVFICAYTVNSGYYSEIARSGSSSLYNFLCKNGRIGRYTDNMPYSYSYEYFYMGGKGTMYTEWGALTYDVEGKTGWKSGNGEYLADWEAEYNMNLYSPISIIFTPFSKLR